MGFFKKIGNAVKKGVKQVSFKNLVKVGGMLDPTGLVSGMQNAHYEQKAAKQAESQGQAEQAAILQAQASQTANMAGSSFGNYVANRSIISDAVQGAIGGAGANVVDLTAKSWFAKHWQKIVFGVGAIATIFVLMRMRSGARSRR
jgi:hypothetical protein